MSHFDSQPRLVGQWVRLRPLETGDFESLYRVASDPEIWLQHFEPNRYERPVFQLFFDRAIDSQSALLILDQASGEVIGTSRYSRLSLENDEVEIGYTFIARRFWGSHYNRDLKYLMIEHAFQFVSNVLFYVFEKNIRSQRALEKLGAEKLELLQGPHHNSYKYRIRRAEWFWAK